MRSPSALNVAFGSFTVAVLVAALGIGFTLWRDGWWPFTVQVAPAAIPAPQLDGDQAIQYSGVAQVRADSACSGWLIDTHSADGPGYLVTNGHCTQSRNGPSTEVGVDLPTDGFVAFGRGGRTAPLPVPAERVAYSTMNGTDIAVIELAATFGQLTNDGVRAYRPAALLPAGRLAVNVGVPVEDVPDSQVAPRLGQCVTGHQVGVVELGWFFDDAQAVDCPGILGGSSGSPLFDRTDRVVGMINTTTVGASPGGTCWLNKPCERTDAGVVPVPDTSYAVSVAGLDSCFSGGRFALTENCPLPRPGVVVQTTVTALNADGDTITAEVTAPARTVLRTGVAPLTATDSCAEEATYASSVPAGPQRTTLETTIPAEEGLYVWCISDPTADQPVAIVLERDLTPPVRTPRLSVDQTDEGYRVMPVFSPPELSDFRIKSGPAAGTDCDDRAGYQPFRRIPTFIPTGRLPAVFCYVGADLAGNETPAFGRTFS